MVEVVVPVRVKRTKVKKTGAVNSAAVFIHDLESDDDFRLMSPADYATVTSPKKADGTHANLQVFKNGSAQDKYVVLAGGQTVDIPGPIYRLQIVPDANVAGSGVDDIEIAYSGKFFVRGT